MSQEKLTRLASLVRDGEATGRQRRQYEKLSRKHPELATRLQETSSVFDSLSGMAFTEEEFVFPEDFNEKIVRRVHLDQRRQTLQYWSPVLVGAVTAAAGLLALIQIMSQAPDSASPVFTDQEARLEAPVDRSLPQFDELGR